MNYTLEEWQKLPGEAIYPLVSERAANAAIYFNGTRRWFLTPHQNWSEYSKITGKSHRELSTLLFTHGIVNLIQPLVGEEMIFKGEKYLRYALEKGLEELFNPTYKEWFDALDIKVHVYGNWKKAFRDMNFSDLTEGINKLQDSTGSHKTHHLYLGLLTDNGFTHVPCPDFIIRSGEPMVWNIPIPQRQNIYYLQAPANSISKPILRCIIYDHLFNRETTNPQTEVLGIEKEVQQEASVMIN